MNQQLRHALSHVLWIGGGTDSGKTTLAQIIAGRYGLQVYHYDRHDLKQITQLAQTSAHYRAFLTDSLDARWVQPTPEALLRWVVRAFQDRFPLVVQDLRALPNDALIVAEGFGLMPEILAPLLASKRQAIWLVPTEAFKWASMRRRGKPSFRDKVSDPGKATHNLFARDMLLAARVTAQTRAHDLKLVEVDGARSIKAMAVLIAAHFEPYLERESP